jgi:hypothetical protein
MDWTKRKPSALLSMPVVFEPPRKIPRRTPDVQTEATDNCESALVPQLSTPNANEFLSLFGAKVPDLSPLQNSTQVTPLPAAAENVCPIATVEPVAALVPATLPSTVMDPFSSAPQYVLHKCEKSPTANASLVPAHDPRLFFAGAPGSMRNDFVACLPRRANIEARKSAGRKVSWVPSGVASITKVEELAFPNGRVYRLKSIFTPNPEYTLTAEVSSKTSSSCKSSLYPSVDETDLYSRINRTVISDLDFETSVNLIL